MSETQDLFMDQPCNPQGYPHIGYAGDLNHVFFLSDTICDDSAQGCGEKSHQASGGGHPAQLLVAAGDFENKPASDKHLDVHRREVAEQAGEEPAKIRQFESLERAVQWRWFAEGRRICCGAHC